MKTEILIIDDEREIGFLLNTVFQSLGLDSAHALTLKGGLEAFKNQKHTHVFLDLNLPDGYGLNIVSRLKEINEDVRIIVITAQGSDDVKREADALGVDQFIVKPFNREQIISALNLGSKKKENTINNNHGNMGNENTNGRIQPRA